MRIIETSTLRPSDLRSNFDELQVYNGLDCTLTHEIHSKIAGGNSEIYAFELALQAPIMEMMLRGFHVNQEAQKAAIKDVRAKLANYEDLLNYLGIVSWGKAINARSPKQLAEYLYGYMGLDRVKKFSKGEVSYPLDKEALEKLGENLTARPIVRLISAIRETTKTLSFFEGKLSEDGRAHTSFNIAGTTTWRLSSSSWIDNTRRNLQNVDADLRYVFEADPGWKLGSIDLEQAESRMVGWICGTTFNKWKYLDYCETKDVHTHLVRLVWNDVDWTGDDRLDKKLASEPFVCGGSNMSRRDRTKRLGHGSNYYGIAKNLAARCFLPVNIVERAVEIYFDQFPEIRLWQNDIIDRIKNNEPIINPFGASRNFLGRPHDASTHREAIAHGPQSAVAMLTNLGMYRVWKNLGLRVRLLLQVHDNIVFMFREDDQEHDVMELAMQNFEVTLKCQARSMTIPGEAYCGGNWGYRRELSNGDVVNPSGLVKWKRRLDK